MIKSALETLEQNSSLPPVAERGADAERRAMILDAAEQVFLEEGFQGASMATIASRSGCSKGTLYNYFVSKEELFLACVQRQCAGIQATMSELASSGGELVETLSQIARRYIAFVTSEATLRRFRVIASEAERSPEMARLFYVNGPLRGATMLASYLDAQMREGVLRETDPLRAAFHFLGLCSNRQFKAQLCNYAPAPNEAQIEEDVAEAVRIFVAAFGRQ